MKNVIRLPRPQTLVYDVGEKQGSLETPLGGWNTLTPHSARTASMSSTIIPLDLISPLCMLAGTGD